MTSTTTTGCKENKHDIAKGKQQRDGSFLFRKEKEKRKEKKKQLINEDESCRVLFKFAY